MSDPYHCRESELGLVGVALTGRPEEQSDACDLLNLCLSQDVIEILDIGRRLISGNQEISEASVIREYSKTGSGTSITGVLIQAQEQCVSGAQLPMFAKAIRDASHSRQLRDAGTALIASSARPTTSIDEIILRAESSLLLKGEVSDVECGKDIVVKFIDHLAERQANQGSLSGIPTGFSHLDGLTDGLQLGELTLIASRPSIGKTAFGISITQHACIEMQIPTLFVTLEMSGKSIMRRLVSSLAQVRMQDLKTGSLSVSQMKSITQANSKIAASPLHFIDVQGGITAAGIASAVRRSIRKHGVKLVVIDYLQKIKPTGHHEKRTYEIGDVSGSLKATVASTETAFVCLAQLNRESEKDKGRVPRLSDLADSGQLERDADTVCLIDRDRRERNGEASIIVAKQRDGECGLIKLWYEGQYCRFENLTDQGLSR